MHFTKVGGILIGHFGRWSQNLSQSPLSQTERSNRAAGASHVAIRNVSCFSASEDLVPTLIVVRWIAASDRRWPLHRQRISLDAANGSCTASKVARLASSLLICRLFRPHAPSYG